MRTLRDRGPSKELYVILHCCRARRANVIRGTKTLLRGRAAAREILLVPPGTMGAILWGLFGASCVGNCGAVFSGVIRLLDCRGCWIGLISLSYGATLGEDASLVDVYLWCVCWMEIQFFQFERLPFRFQLSR